MTDTIDKILGGRHYHDLSTKEKEALQDRQTTLVIRWQDSTCEKEREAICSELLPSLEGLVASMAYRYAENSYSIEKEDFVGIINVVLSESLIFFDRKKGKPFQPVFILNVRNAIKMMYREKGYDLHDTSDRLDKPVSKASQFYSDTDYLTVGQVATVEDTFTSDIETNVMAEGFLSRLFKNNDLKKTIIHMWLDDFTRKEIIAAINTEGKTDDAVARYVNRTILDFKGFCKSNL